MPAKKILVVEDDLDIRENMTSLLQYEGYQVLGAEHGAEAMRLLEMSGHELPDVILLDLFMPIMNGREFLDAIEKSTIPKVRDIPVVLITASEANVRQDLEARTAAIFMKPMDLKAFLVLLNSILA